MTFLSITKQPFRMRKRLTQSGLAPLVFCYWVGYRWPPRRCHHFADLYATR